MTAHTGQLLAEVVLLATSPTVDKTFSSGRRVSLILSPTNHPMRIAPELFGRSVLPWI